MHRYAQGVSFWGQRRHKLLALLVLVCIVDLVMEWKSSAGKRLSRFARPVLRLVPVGTLLYGEQGY